MESGDRPNYHLYQYPNGNTIGRGFDAEGNISAQLILFRLCQLFLRKGVPPKAEAEAKKMKVEPHGGGTPDTFQKILRKHRKVDAKPDDGTARALDFTKYGYTIYDIIVIELHLRNLIKQDVCLSP